MAAAPDAFAVDPAALSQVLAMLTAALAPDTALQAQAYAALEEGGTAPAVLNAANEEAVAAFLEGRVGFWDISACNREVLERLSTEPARSLEQLLDLDRRAREVAQVWICSR